MSDVAIFAAGSVVFVITSWATLAYGLSYAHQMRRRDLETSPHVEVRPDGKYTNIYTQSDVADAPTAPATTQPSGSLPPRAQG